MRGSVGWLADHTVEEDDKVGPAGSSTARSTSSVATTLATAGPYPVAPVSALAIVLR